MFGLQLDSSVVALYGSLVVLHFVVGCSQIAMICCHLRIDLDGFDSQLYLLLEVALLADCLSLQIKEITGVALLCEVEALVAGLCQFAPAFEVQKGICLDHVFFLGIGHRVGERKKLLVLFFVLEGLDLGGCFLIGLEDHGPAILEVVELHLHLCLFIIYQIQSQSHLINAYQHSNIADNSYCLRGIISHLWLIAIDQESKHISEGFVVLSVHMSWQEMPSGQYTSPQMVLLRVAAYISSLLYYCKPRSISLLTTMFECITESFTPLSCRRSTPTEPFLVMKFSTTFGFDFFQQARPLPLFQYMQLFSMCARESVSKMPSSFRETSFLIILRCPEWTTLMPMPGLSEIVFSSRIVWCELAPPSAILHYMLRLISFCSTTALLFSCIRMPYLKFLYILLALMIGNASFSTFMPDYSLKPIIWLLRICVLLFQPEIKMPLSLLAAIPMFLRMMALQRNFLQDLQTMPFCVFLSILLKEMTGKELFTSMPSLFSNIMLLLISGSHARPTFTPIRFFNILLLTSLSLNSSPTICTPMEFPSMRHLMTLELVSLIPQMSTPPSRWLLIIQFQAQSVPSLQTTPIVFLSSLPFTSELAMCRQPSFSIQTAGMMVLQDLTRQLRLRMQLERVALPLSSSTMMLSILLKLILFTNSLYSCSMFSWCSKIFKMCSCSNSYFFRLLSELPLCENFMPAIAHS